MTEPLIVDNSKNTEAAAKSAAQIYTSSEEEQDVENTTVAQIGANNDSILSGLNRSLKADEIENDSLDENSESELESFG